MLQSFYWLLFLTLEKGSILNKVRDDEQQAKFHHHHSCLHQRPGPHLRQLQFLFQRGRLFATSNGGGQSAAGTPNQLNVWLHHRDAGALAK